MAVGTDVGVAVYQGETCLWQRVGLPEPVASAAVQDLAFDRYGNLWVATGKGLAHVQEGKTEVYDTSDGLPNPDVNRIQMQGNTIFAGCFGGFVVRGLVSNGGRCTFSPVNFKSGESGDAKHLQTIGVSTISLDGSSGWVTTKGSGIRIISGVSHTTLDMSSGLPSDWVEAVWRFNGPSRTTRRLVATNRGLALMQEETVVTTVAPPGLEKPWVTSVTTVHPGESTAIRTGGETEEIRTLWDFIGPRILWVGTRDDGLWKFQDGSWTQFLPENSRLPSRRIHRLYARAGRLLAATDGGLLMISLRSQEFDEFAKTGLGTSFKTIYPAEVQCPVIGLAIGNGFWCATTKGLSRFAAPAGVGERLLQGGGSEEQQQEEGQQAGQDTSEDDSREADVPKQLGSGPEAPESEVASQTSNRVDSGGNLMKEDQDRITSIAADQAGAIWVILREKELARVRVVPQEGNPRGRRQWDFFPAGIFPWPDGTVLTTVWAHDGHLYVGTRGCGFYRLDNPELKIEQAGEFDWKPFGLFEGLTDRHIIGFASWRVPGAEPQLVILHPKRTSLYDGTQFQTLSLGAEYDFRCLCADAAGNLWFGTYGGLLRLTAERKLFSYGVTNANFDSSRITAVAASSKNSPGGVSLWVACDQAPEGSDKLPNVIRMPDGTKRVLECLVDGASLHYFDGLTWDKWKVPGVLCMIADGDYLYMGTNIRLRRFYLP